EAVDPYAKSAGLNGRRGMIVNFSEINDNLAGWNEDTLPTTAPNAVDSSIYEIHVRDMTINPNSNVEHPGTFLGLAEKGTSYTEGDVTVSTGLDHLEELGVSTVQIQPVYDYKSVDEANVKTTMDDENYNWGYDPQNYNALEGSYSTDPTDGACRIKEFKQMILAMHSYGIGVNMDVVYNHTYETLNSNFGLIVPDYYYHIDGNGNYYNGSGCGNEVASNHEMVRKFIVDSVSFWASEYHLSGFRFDLMGLEDNQTMIDVYSAMQEINPLIRVYGEPWTGGTSALTNGTSATRLSTQQTVQNSLGQDYFAGAGIYVGAFNDQLRDGVKGSVFMENNKWTGAWVQGNENKGYMAIKAGISGVFSLSTVKAPEPGQVIQYVSCHDNNTLHDQLIQTNGEERDLVKMATQSQAVVFTCQGVPFFQEGDDFLRSKAYTDASGKTVYEHNSYKSGDSVNNMDYALKAKNIEVFEKFRDIIELRKNNPEFRLSERSKITESVKDVLVYSRQDNPSGNISYAIDNTAEGGNYIKVIHCLNGADFDLGTDEYEMIYSNVGDVATGKITGTLTLTDNQSVVLRKA
nr:type I pullulanase [Bacilli bacterium]